MVSMAAMIACRWGDDASTVRRKEAHSDDASNCESCG